jgi:DNA modification methylase
MSKQLAAAMLLDLKVEQRSIESLKPYRRNARVHSQKQIAQIAAAIRRFGFLVAILIGADGTILAGHGRWSAAKLLGMTIVPVIQLDHMTEAERRAFAIADNRLAELAGWDEEILAIELQELEALDLDFDLELTGFGEARLDELLGVDVAPKLDPKADQIPETGGPAVTRLGDVWALGKHRLLCGDARSANSYEILMQGDSARMVMADAPYNVPIDGHAGGSGKIARRNFVQGFGEMSRGEFTTFLTEVFVGAAAVCLDGAIAFAFMDWRHLGEVLAAGETAFDELKNVVVWVKTNGGMGSFYRSQHELIFVFKKGSAPHLNTFGLGDTGRYRTNCWTYPGVNTFRAGRAEDLARHPTTKPVALIADAIRDVSHRGDIVLDPFGGSGTTAIAAEKTKRRARLIELDPLYCDTICRRWQSFSKSPAVLAAGGQTFDEISVERCGDTGGPDDGEA